MGAPSELSPDWRPALPTGESDVPYRHDHGSRSTVPRHQLTGVSLNGGDESEPDLLASPWVGLADPVEHGEPMAPDAPEEPPPEAAPWRDIGYDRRPPWWHYWEERADAAAGQLLRPARPHGAQEAAAAAAEQSRHDAAAAAAEHLPEVPQRVDQRPVEIFDIDWDEPLPHSPPDSDDDCAEEPQPREFHPAAYAAAAEAAVHASLAKVFARTTTTAAAAARAAAHRAAAAIAAQEAATASRAAAAAADYAAAAAAAAAPEQVADAPQAAERPLDVPEQDGSFHAGNGYSSRADRERRYDEYQAIRAARADDPQDLDFDFSAPPLRDGAWNRSSHVSKLIAKGFSISVDTTKRGKKPPPLDLKTPDERAYIKRLLDDGVITPGPVEFVSSHFFIWKPGKLRLIFNGRRLNRGVKTPPRFNMKAHKTLARLATKHSWHAAEDLKNMFFSIPIAKDCRRHFGIRTRQGTFQYTRLPFGFNWSPFIAHICADEIVKRLLEEGHAATHYLDDFHVFGSTKQDCADAQARLRELLGEANWRINPKKTELPAQQFTALGVTYDLRAKTSEYPKSKFDAAYKRHLDFIATNAAVTKKQIAAFVGSFVFADKAYPGFLSHLTGALAYLKAAKGWRAIHEYREFAPFAQRAFDKLQSLQPQRLQCPTKSSLDLFTDATNTQLGIVTPDYTAAIAVPFKQIYRSEAVAASWLLRQPLPTPEIRLRIDNEALVHAIQKGRSNIPEANALCRKILDLRQAGAIITTKHVRTEVNPADIPSRMHLLPSQLFVSPTFAKGA